MKKKAQTTSKHATNLDKPITLKDLLNPDIINKLQVQADQMKATEAAEKAAEKDKVRKLAEEVIESEQKRLENDFAYLLKNSSMDWRKNK